MTPNEQRYYDLLVANVPIAEIGRRFDRSRTQIYRIIDKLVADKHLKKPKKRGIYVAR